MNKLEERHASVVPCVHAFGTFNREQLFDQLRTACGEFGAIVEQRLNGREYPARVWACLDVPPKSGYQSARCDTSTIHIRLDVYEGILECVRFYATILVRLQGPAFGLPLVDRTGHREWLLREFPAAFAAAWLTIADLMPMPVLKDARFWVSGEVQRTFTYGPDHKLVPANDVLDEPEEAFIEPYLATGRPPDQEWVNEYLSGVGKGLL